MNIQLDVRILSSLALYIDYKLLKVGKAYTNYSSYLYPINTKLNGLYGYATPFKQLVNDFTFKRYMIEGASKDIEDKIDKLGDLIAKETGAKFGNMVEKTADKITNTVVGKIPGVKIASKIGKKILGKTEDAVSENYFQNMLLKYKITHNFDDVKDYLIKLGQYNEDSNRDDMIKECLTLFMFYVSPRLPSDLKEVKQQTITEGITFDNFFYKLFKRMTQITKEIEELEAEIDNVNMFSFYTSINENNEDYRYYNIVDETITNINTCQPPLVLFKASKKGPDDIGY